ncbi:MAG: hypothetical protein WA020_06870 [Candidatus Acidiferrales bacterium]
MRKLLLAIFLTAATCWAQESGPLNLRPAAQTQPQAESQAQPQQAIIVPAGTRIRLTLANPITSRSHKGDSVRAAVAFAVMVGARVAIPSGTYVQGAITEIVERSSSGPSVKIKFSSMVYANGYTVALDGSNLQAKITDAPADPATAGVPAGGATGNALAGKGAPGQTSPMPPALTPPPGPNKGLIIGLGVGGAAAAVAAALIIGHNSGGASRGSVLFDTGWQFDMVLNNPLPVNAASATPAPRAS